MRICLALLVSLALTACSYPYRVPEVSKGGEIRGVADYFTSTDRTVRVILTHGMCSDAHRGPDDTLGKGQVNWVALRARQIARAIGSTADVTTLPVRRTDYGPGPRKVQRYDIDIPAPAGTVAASFLIWGRHVDPHRAALEYENTSRPDDPDAPRRAPVNALLKRELMNRCLLDAVVYLGESGDPIRHGMRAAVCDTMDGQFTAASPPGAAGKRALCRGSAASGMPTILVPESLGSTILFDAYQSLGDRAGQARIAASLQDLRAVFLASNQIPLLRQGNEPADAVPRAARRDGDSLDRFLALLGQARAPRLARPPIQIVAITDPNDVLGYRLDLARYAGTRYEARNVLVSNAPTLLGLVADPMAAHANTARSAVFDFISNGTDP